MLMQQKIFLFNVLRQAASSKVRILVLFRYEQNAPFRIGLGKSAVAINT